ncbi:MAG: ATP-binding protein [Mycobacterium sp.]
MKATAGSASASEPNNGPTRFRRDQLAADARSAGQARSDFDLWLRSHFALSAAGRIDLTVAVNEAVANAAEHAYLSSPFGQGTFDVEALYDAAQDSLTVIVQDRGRWQLPDPTVTARSARGRGIQLMHALADYASIDATAAGTRVCLTWLQLHQRTGPGLG